MPLLARLIPFLFLGMIVVIFVVGIVLLSYLLIIGAIVGLILFAVAWIRDKFRNKKLPTQPKKRSGQTINHDDL